MRTPLPADRPALTALCRRCLIFDHPTEALLQEKIWDDPDYNPDLVLGMEHGGQLAALAMGVVRGDTGYIKLIAVEPQLRGMGYGGRLLTELERRMAPHVSRFRVAESAPNYWWPGVDVRYTGAVIFFERHGYRKFDQTYNMTVDLTNLPEDGLRPNNITIRRAQAADRDLLDRFLARLWPAWRAEAAAAMSRGPIALHLGFVDDQPAGFAAYDSNNPGTGWFGPMGTDPAFRGNGLGRALLLACLRDQRAQGLDKATIPWVGPIAFYHRAVNAEIDRVFFRYRKENDAP
ncbi:MAG: GNAT family N-acetyltransferase [Acidobacteriota bacterium]|nr:GNAT family N-acetyltransferase [Acidobacteriota bacterium]